MRRRLLSLAIVTTAVLGAAQFAAAPAQAVATTCSWTTWSENAPLLGGYSGVLRAGPLVEAGATSVDVTCEVRYGDSDGPVRVSDTQTTPGSVGFYAMGWHLFDLPSGDYYACTRVRTYPGGAGKNLGCQHAFTI